MGILQCRAIRGYRHQVQEALMGVSIDLHVYDYFALVQQIDDIVQAHGGAPEGRTLHEFVDKVMPHFGIRAADKFITLWNEYYEDANSGYELFRAVAMYFDLDDVFLSGYEYVVHANAREVFDELGIEPLGAEEEY